MSELPAPRRSHLARSFHAQYWPHAMGVAALIVATVGLRVHENIPYLSVIRSAALAAYGGGLVLLTRSSGEVLRATFRDPTVRVVAAYFLWITCTAPFALWPGLAIGMLQIGPPILILVISVLLCAPDRLRMDQSALAFCASAAALGALALGLRGTVVDAGTERLSEQGSLDANDLAAAMAMAFPFAAGLAVRGGLRRRLLGVAIALVCVAAVVRSGSRGGTLALGVGAIVFTLGLKGAKRFGVIAALAIAAFVTWNVAPEGFKNRMANAASEDYNYTEYSGRKQIWARGRGYLVEHPVAGVGAGNFPVAEGDYAAALGRRAKWSAAHNAYLQAFVELGVIGGGLFIALLALSVRRSWHLWTGKDGPDWHRPEYVAAIAAFCTSAYFLSHAYFYPLFALCAAIALADRAARLASATGVAPPSWTSRVRRGVAAVRPTAASGRSLVQRRFQQPARPALPARPVRRDS